MDEFFREISTLKVKSLLSILAVFLLGGVAADAQQDEVIKMRFAGYKRVPLEEVLDRQAHRQAENNAYRNRVASHWPKALRWDLRGQNLGSYCMPKQLCGSGPGTGFTE